MNIYGVVILAALLLEYALSGLARLLNLKALRPEPPPGFEDVYDAEAYRESQVYTRAATRFGLLTSTVQLAALLAFWGLGGFAWLDARVRATGLDTPWDGLLFFAALGLAAALLSLPFDAWETFVLEARFGFNRTTVRTFVLDRLKGLALAVALGGPLLAAVLLFFARAGDNAWWLCWLIAVAASLVLQVVFPIWILPLFNRLEPLPEGALRDALRAYAGRAGYELDGIFVMDGSKRSTRGNAFFTGFGKTRRIALFDTLIEQQTVPELVAVLAHEVGHAKHRHILKVLLLSILHTGVVFYLLQVVLEHRGLFAAFGIAEPSVHAGLVFFGLLFTPVELVLGLGLNALLRRHEYQADRFAATTTTPGAVTSALVKLARDNLANLTPHPFFVVLNHSHPPLVERVAAIRATADSPSLTT